MQAVAERPDRQSADLRSRRFDPDRGLDVVEPDDQAFARAGSGGLGRWATQKMRRNANGVNPSARAG